MQPVKTTTKWSTEWQEYIVTLWVDGKKEATYHTDDKEDAEATAEEMEEEARRNYNAGTCGPLFNKTSC